MTTSKTARKTARKTASKTAKAEAVATETEHFAFDTNVPIPPVARRGNKYNFDEMPVEGTFRVPIDDTPKIRAALGNYSRKAGVKFVTRTVTEDGVNYLRVWRVE